MDARNGAVSGDAATLWPRVAEGLRRDLGARTFDHWLKPVRFADYCTLSGVVTLETQSRFSANWINERFGDRLELAWRQHLPAVRGVTVRGGAAAAARAETLATQPLPAFEAPQPAAANPALLGFDPRLSFDRFVVARSNILAANAARRMAMVETPQFNPLYLCSGTGQGKTHLLQAIAAESLRQNPKSRVVYLTAEYFMWRFATAIRDNNALTLKEQLRDIDLLIIDDMQFLQGKSIQHEFCHLLNMLLDSAKQVVVAADRPPSELESLEPRVRSRLNGGVALEMSAPDFSMRLGMLKLRLATARADDTAIDIADDILEHVARTITGSGRELEGAFNQLLFRQSFEPQISIDRIDEILGHIYRSGEPKRVRIEDIQRIVARHYNVSKTELLSNRRTRTIVKPRQVAMYLSKVMTPRSLPEIGRRFGGRDHTTVLHAVRKIEDLSGSDNTLAQELELLRRLITDQA